MGTETEQKASSLRTTPLFEQRRSSAHPVRNSGNAVYRQNREIQPRCRIVSIASQWSRG